MSYNKLVRDRIPEIIEQNGEIPKIRKLDDEEFKSELEKKLLEECNEVLDSNYNNRLEELADILEVINYLATLEGENLDTVIKLANEKKKLRGGFDKKIYLMGVKN